MSNTGIKNFLKVNNYDFTNLAKFKKLREIELLPSSDYSYQFI